MMLFVMAIFSIRSNRSLRAKKSHLTTELRHFVAL